MQRKGIPIGRAAEVNLRNNHAQYIFTWQVNVDYPSLISSAPYFKHQCVIAAAGVQSAPTSFLVQMSQIKPKLTVPLFRYALAAATSIMFYLVVKKPSKDVTRRVRKNYSW